MVGSLPANAGDTGSGPGLGGSHVPRSGWARAPQLLSPHATTNEACMPQLLKPARPEPMLHNKRSHRNERSAHARKSSPRSPQLKKTCVQQQRPNAAKNK